jgi:hypothetical protein
MAENVIGQIRVGDVKALVFLANEPVEMKIVAHEPGWFTLDVFTPSSEKPHHFGPLAVDPCDKVRMTMLPGEVTLRRG